MLLWAVTNDGGYNLGCPKHPKTTVELSYLEPADSGQTPYALFEIRAYQVCPFLIGSGLAGRTSFDQLNGRKPRIKRSNRTNERER